MRYSYDRTAAGRVIYDRRELAPNEHYTEKCSGCGTVISSCRCSGPHKTILLGLCNSCKGLPAPEPSPWVREAAVNVEQRAAAVKHLKGRGLAILNELIRGMADEAKKDGIKSFGMKDATQIMRVWFSKTADPETPVEEAGTRYLRSVKGAKLANLIVTGVAEVMKKQGAPVGFQDIGKIVVSFMAGEL